MDDSINQINSQLENADFLDLMYRKFFVNDFRRYLRDAGFSLREIHRLRYHERTELWKMFSADKG